MQEREYGLYEYFVCDRSCYVLGVLAIALAMLLRLSRVAGLLSLVAAASLSNAVGNGGWGRLTKKKLARLNAQRDSLLYAFRPHD